MPTGATNASALTRVVKLTGNLPPFLQGRYGYRRDTLTASKTRVVSVSFWYMVLQMDMPDGVWETVPIDEAARMDYVLDYCLNNHREIDANPACSEAYKAGERLIQALSELTVDKPPAFSIEHLALYPSKPDYCEALRVAGRPLDLAILHPLWQKAENAAKQLTEVEQRIIG